MPIINTNSRDQLQLLNLQEHISKNNPVRIIDAFCNTFSPEELGFTIKGLSHEDE